jgi:hypothetical protein
MAHKGTGVNYYLQRNQNQVINTCKHNQFKQNKNGLKHPEKE